MKNLATLLASLLIVTSSAQAELASALNELPSKGAFGLNILQGERSRTTVRSGNTPSGRVLFLAAYRNDQAQALVDRHDFYIGNLFSTNYYQLMGEFVYGDSMSNHALDHQALLAVGDAPMQKAAHITTHWVLEQHYVKKFPDSRLAGGFQRRGIGGSEYEQQFSVHYFNYYLSRLTDDYQYLAGYLLAQNSPIISDRNLQRARDIMTETYDFWQQQGQTPMVRAIRSIRNLVHNQLSRNIIEVIDQFDRDFPQYRREGHTYIFRVRDILVDYYATTAQKITEAADQADSDELVSAAQDVLASRNSPESLLNLSQVAVSLRSDIGNSQRVSYRNRAKTLAALSVTSQFLRKEVETSSSQDSQIMAEIAVNLAYVEGFLIFDNWEYFVEDIRAGADVAEILSFVVEIGTETLRETFDRSLDQWLQVSSEMEYFIDNTVKASALTSSALLLEKL